MKRIIAILLTLTLLLTFCACGKKTEEPSVPAGGETADVPTAEPAEPEATPEPEEMAYATEHGFKFVSAAEPMNYSYPSMQHVVGYIDPEYEEEMNQSIYQLTSVEPLADDPDYLVYTIKGTHDGRVNMTAAEDASVEERYYGSTYLGLEFVDGNTGYRIPQKNVYYTNNDHQEYDVTVSSEGEEAAENEVTLQDILDAQGFVWNGEEVHITLLYSGDSTWGSSREPVGNGRYSYYAECDVTDTYTLIAPAGYTGLCVGVDLSTVDAFRGEETDSGETPALALFEPEEGSNYYFQRLDEMAAPLFGVTDGAEKCASAKSVETDTEELAAVMDLPCYAEWGALYPTDDDANVWRIDDAIINLPADTTERMRNSGVEDILIANPDPFQYKTTGRDIQISGQCQMTVVNMSTGLLVEIVAFDGERNIVGRSGTVAPGEFITEFALDEVPAENFDVVRCNGYIRGETLTPAVEETEALIGLYVYLYDLDGNLLYTGPLATQ